MAPSLPAAVAFLEIFLEIIINFHVSLCSLIDLLETCGWRRRLIG